MNSDEDGDSDLVGSGVSSNMSESYFCEESEEQFDDEEEDDDDMATQESGDADGLGVIYFLNDGYIVHIRTLVFWDVSAKTTRGWSLRSVWTCYLSLMLPDLCFGVLIDPATSLLHV